MISTLGYKIIAVTIFMLALVALTACSSGGDASSECIEASEEAGLDQRSVNLLKDKPVSDWSDDDIIHVAFAYADLEMSVSPNESSHIGDVCEGLSDKLGDEVDKRDF